MAKAPGIIASNKSPALDPCLMELLESAAIQIRREMDTHFKTQCTDQKSAAENEEKLQLLYARLTPLQDQIVNTPAQNIEEILVKLRLFAWCRQEDSDEIPADAPTDERAMASLLIDMRNLKLA